MHHMLPMQLAYDVAKTRQRAHGLTIAWVRTGIAPAPYLTVALTQLRNLRLRQCHQLGQHLIFRQASGVNMNCVGRSRQW